MTIFEHLDYREYLESKLKTKDYGRGGKAKLAVHLSCQPSFVSQVLKGKSSFSLEQGFKINSFLKHNSLEKEFFMVLIEFDRAGTHDLKNYFDEKRKELVEKSKLVENQMSYDQLSEADTLIYYSNWNHILIRNFIEILEFSKIKSLKKRLNLPEKDFNEALGFLIEKGLIKETEGGVLKQGHAWLHIKKDTSIAKYANITARMHMLKNFEKAGYNSMNYTSFMTLPKKSFEEFKKRLVALVVELNSHLKEKPNSEMMAALAIDFLEI